ncbi:Sec20-domain-containing protein [Gamsiella multidivaricata]|uniref:Sec20-domain-containing protein n=1 Tax=Gamsiella multidivaricata TaxID=101098 RepID=UPI00221FAC60|nr:Sec20-domain-containing protein [Gamsiella multidivaricata]KAG0364746.1 hypothetical protein BGZ54_007192 [Gamsiella multidivaricata]KAI7820074.1 Sec20-domain-containing protein [Gamsiella multidivaricata]
MPPLPSQILPRSIQAQMDELRKQYHSLDSHIGRLKTLSGATLSVQQELVRSAREESKTIEAKIEELRQLSDEQDREADRSLVLAMLEKIETQFKQQQQALRQAILTSKQTIDREIKTERELLLKGSKSAIELSELRRRGNSLANSGEYLLNTSKETNESLSRTLKLMQQEVERTANSAKIIDESSKTLKETVNEYQTYDEVLKRGKNLITKLNQADWTDRLLIGFGLLVFALVVMYILKKRIADRGISLIGCLLMPVRWALSLLVPSLRTPPGSPSTTTDLAGTVIKKVATSTVRDVTVQFQRAATTLVRRPAPTSPAQGILGILDAIVGE